MTWKFVELSYQGVIATVTLNRPDKHNSINAQMLGELIACAEYLKNDPDIRSVIVTGNGPSFSSGMDLKDIMTGGWWKKLRAFLPLWKPTMNRYQKVSLVWRSLSVPVVAAIHGNCFGAGLQIALGADIRIAAPTSQLSIMESNWGLVPDMGGTVLLREVLPKDIAMELTFSGRTISALDAKVLGLVTHVADDPLGAAINLCHEFQQQSPDALAAGKKLLIGAWSVSEASALRLERLWQRRVIGKRNQSIAVSRRLKKSKQSYITRTW
ncbi:crotonase/enoyl-CoA hydratase family protein [Pseudomonas sp. RGM2987]|uniref:crotonase/enoyl-CoA hydratase family protein n=1 Tax=Pseudomonas sp. RGM2987 TaxID=2930090 RepID=UPI001FD65D96|nr:crotonase/enoyl-CoA hydratase family protein [Pseudomonas sp. RGM2987]